MTGGQLPQLDFMDNTGGLNLSDSVFKIQSTQATGGYNYDYVLTGGIRKRLGPSKINSVANAQLRTLGLGFYNAASGETKVNIRAAGTKLQYVDLSDPTTATFTDLTQDNLAASSTPFNDISRVDFIQFNSSASNILWGCGGGTTYPVGAVSTSKYTVNGVDVPTGTLTAGSPTGSDGCWTATGTYQYAIALQKASTGAISNAVLTSSAVITTAGSGGTGGQHVPLSFASLGAFDKTEYNKIAVYRSFAGGVVGFTTGELVALVDSTLTSYNDLGDFFDIEFDVNVPRSGNIVEDHTKLPAGTYANPVVYRQRLVVCSGNTVYLSANGNSEYWGLTDVITVPSAGEITGLGVISFTAPQANALTELLVIFKERETLVLTGDSALGSANGQIGDPYTLLSVDSATGCSSHGTIVSMQGWLAWIDYRGVHIWDGGGKPYYASRLIESMFQVGGEIDKSKFSLCSSQFFQRENQIIWYLSSQSFGEQQLALKMDVRLTLIQVEQQLTGRNIDAVFARDFYAFPIYAASSFIPSGGRAEQMVLGDGSGFLYYASNAASDAGAATEFTYLTPPINCGDPNVKKQFYKVIVWVANVGDWDLSLDYWSNFITNPGQASTRSAPISTSQASTSSLWDVAVYDASYWDTFSPTNVVPIVFNLGSDALNNSQGTAIQLQFRNENANEPVTIHGYSLFWNVLGGVTA